VLRSFCGAYTWSAAASCGHLVPIYVDFCQRHSVIAFAAFAAGLGLTALLQSSTATGLMAASFTAEGLVGLVPALAIMLGANVGTTLIVQILSFNISAAAPVLFVVGLLAFRAGARTWVKDVGRVAIGLGLILLALHILLDTLAPAENAPGVRALLDSITGDPVLCVLVAAALTWAAHSSVATVLLIMSLAYSHFITPTAALALVLGANLGSAINPVVEGGRRDDPASYRLPVGNLLNRLIGVVLFAPFLQPIGDVLGAVQPDMAKMTAEFHGRVQRRAGRRFYRLARPALLAVGENLSHPQAVR
jgi:phosphate:Na+ symporter